jgi:hypothetical protein
LYDFTPENTSTYNLVVKWGYNLPIRYIDTPEILLDEAHEIRIYLSELSSLAEDLYEPADVLVVH